MYTEAATSRDTQASLSAKKHEANAKAMAAMRKGRGMRGGRGGEVLKEDGALLLGAHDETDEVSPAGGLAGEEMGGGGGSYAAPEVPTISREQWERDFAIASPAASAEAMGSLRASSGGALAGGAAVVAKPVPVAQYNSRVGRARVANAARIHARSHACSLDPATVASMEGSQPGSPPPPATVPPATVPPTTVPQPEPTAAVGAAAPTGLMD